MTGVELINRIALGCVCAIVSMGMIAANSDDFLIVGGSAPATIWAPDVGRVTVIILVLLAVAAVVVAPRGTRWPALALWLVILAVLTHRVVDGRPDPLRDQWLNTEVAIWADIEEVDAALAPCPRSLVPALCFTHKGKPGRIITILPFKAMP